MALASELQMRPLLAHCHLGRGKLHGRGGDAVGAREQLTIATGMCDAMSMRS